MFVTDPSILPSVPRVQFRGNFVSGLSKSLSPFSSPPFHEPLHQILHHSFVIVAVFCSICSHVPEFSPFHRLEGSCLLFLSPFISQL